MRVRANGVGPRNASAIRSFNGTFVPTKRPPGCVIVCTRPAPDVFCLTDATSNLGRGSDACACARNGVGPGTLIVSPATTTKASADDRQRVDARFIENFSVTG